MSSWQFTPYLLPIAGAVAIALFLAVYTWGRRHTKGAAEFFWLILAVGIWSLGYVFEIGSTGIPLKVFFAQVQYLGIVGTPLAWLAFALRFTNRDEWITRRNLAWAAAIPVLTLLLVWTNHFHGLIWREITLDVSGPFAALAFKYGPGFWLNWIFANIYLVLGTWLLLQMLSSAATLYRRQTAALLIVALAPWIGNGLYVLRLSPIPNLDWTPVAFALSGVIMAFSLFRLRLLEIMPIARRTIVDVMADGVIVLDDQQRVVDINPAAQQEFGLEPVSIIGRDIESVFDNWPPLVQLCNSAQESEADVHLKVRDDDRYYAVRVTLLLNRKQLPTGMLLVLRDRTERKLAERALAQAHDEALAASEFKSQLLANVSHELRTPLGVILGYGELLSGGTFGALSEQQRKAVDDIVIGAYKLSSIVDHLIDQAHLASDQLRLEPKPFEVRGLIDTVDAVVRPRAASKGLKLICDVAADMPPRIIGDRRRLESILYHVADNAIKFTPEGQVEIRLFPIDHEQWAMQVEDTGLGIPAEAQTAVFEPFRQLDGSVTREYGGTGLGLSIVKQLTSLMNGTISLRSELNRGSCIRIAFPLETA